MSRVPVRPPGGYPWEKPGHTFKVDFPPGYKPRLADDALMTLNQRKKRDEADGVTSSTEKY